MGVGDKCDWVNGRDHLDDIPHDECRLLESRYEGLRKCLVRIEIADTSAKCEVV